MRYSILVKIYVIVSTASFSVFVLDLKDTINSIVAISITIDEIFGL